MGLWDQGVTQVKRMAPRTSLSQPRRGGGPSVPCLCVSRLMTVRSIYVQYRAQRRSESFSCSPANWGYQEPCLAPKPDPQKTGLLTNKQGKGDFSWLLPKFTHWCKAMNGTAGLSLG